MRNKLEAIYITFTNNSIIFVLSSGYNKQRFQDLFVTAGYGTAFGAAMGAVLSFKISPKRTLGSLPLARR